MTELVKKTLDDLKKINNELDELLNEDSDNDNLSPGLGSNGSSNNKNDSQQDKSNKNSSNSVSDLNLDNSDSAGNGNENEQDKSNMNSNSNEKPLPSKVNFRGQEIDLDNPYNNDMQLDEESKEDSKDSLDRMTNDFIEQAIKEASTMQGFNGSGGMLRQFQREKVKPPSWTSILTRFLQVSPKVDITYSRAHKNRITKVNNFKIIMPGVRQEKSKLKDILFAIDASGSMSDEYLSKAFNLMTAILKKYKYFNAMVCFWDGIVDKEHVKNLKDMDDLKRIDIFGGGSTNPECALEFAEEMDCKYVVLFTDGYFTKPKASKWKDKFKVVIWNLITKEQYIDFGDPPFGYKSL